MSHLPALITDLALILISAGIITLLFKWLKQPLVLGYIVVGILAGPYFNLFPTVVDQENIAIWAEIGVIFLLFALGLEFSFKKLMRVGGSAFITALTEVVSMLAVGFLLGRALHWTVMDSIFLGGMLSMSSTTIIIKAFNDLGLRNRKFTGIVFGTLVVEDLVAILMMVMLSTVAVSKQFEGEAMLISLLKLAFFLVLWFLIGIYLLPTFFKKARRLMNEETLLVISLGLCLGMVVLATHTGFSAALGAFIMGSILAETFEGQRIEHLIKGLKDFFGAVFFVSVGMMVNPAVLYEYAVPVLLISLATIVGKALFSTLGVLLAGEPLKVSIQSGFSLAQIGEFAFIIASLGFSLGVMSGFIYPIIVAVSVITTFTTPYFIRLSLPFYRWLKRKLPARILEALNRYASGGQTVNHDSDWKRLLRENIVILLICSVILTAVVWVATRFLSPFLGEHMPRWAADSIAAVVSLAVMSPFLRVLLITKNNVSPLFRRLWNDDQYKKGGLVSLILFRALVAVFFVGFLLYDILDFGLWVVGGMAVVIIGLIYLFRLLLIPYFRMEAHFLHNLNQKEEEEKQQQPLTTTFDAHLSDRDVHLSGISVSSDSPLAGKTIREADLKKRFGIRIVKIIRGSYVLNLPALDERIFPADRLVVLGSDDQLARFAKEAEYKAPDSEVNRPEMLLRSFTIGPDSLLAGRCIGNSGIRECTHCLVVGIDRNDRSLMNPDADTKLEPGDLVWVVGEEPHIYSLLGYVPAAGNESPTGV